MFQSTHSLRSATFRGQGAKWNAKFQSTHSLRSATAAVFDMLPWDVVSIHALLAECDYFFCWL